MKTLWYLLLWWKGNVDVEILRIKFQRNIQSLRETYYDHVATCFLYGARKDWNVLNIALKGIIELILSHITIKTGNWLGRFMDSIKDKDVVILQPLSAVSRLRTVVQYTMQLLWNYVWSKKSSARVITSSRII
jgi:hypothetical protein